ncbi:hypothetical protein EYF80_015378 [Liparis tanakae]|uniref:Uncharacterized protein n=1 Tax=Liparis tanakae TaxID=230148 RepID=A0A4Z2I8M9_9TELE|nr:hypothetical protein EYF80_015378 [Liparis tanakae]
MANDGLQNGFQGINPDVTKETFKAHTQRAEVNFGRISVFTRGVVIKSDRSVSIHLSGLEELPPLYAETTPARG